MFSLSNSIFLHRSRMTSALNLSIGLLAFFLPLSLVLGNLLFFQEYRIQPSVSHYYYTRMSAFYITALSTFGLFMLFQNRKRLQGFWYKTAGTSAFCTAYIPTMPVGGKEDPANFVHLLSAFVLFLSVAILALVYLPKTKVHTDIPKCISRSFLYRFCGAGILGCLLTLVLFFIIVCYRGGTTVNSISVFLIESVMIALLGMIWIVKSRE